LSPVARVPRMGAERFERLYEHSADPWRYETSAYEQEKYSDTLAALPPGKAGRTLEVGCSIGVFTQQLAARCERLVAIDFAEQALTLARERLVGLEHVQVRHASFPEQAPAGPWDVVVCSEVLYYLDEPALCEAVAWLTRQLHSGASVIAVSWRGRGTEEPLHGDDVHDLLAVELSRWHSFDGRRRGYRLDRFDGDGR
jgi:2-polyprenyl-3-methyl-5-hydroxy-6-metoxy-1,4-benzoquinol methylase